MGSHFSVFNLVYRRAHNLGNAFFVLSIFLININFLKCSKPSVIFFVWISEVSGISTIIYSKVQRLVLVILWWVGMFSGIECGNCPWNWDPWKWGMEDGVRLSFSFFTVFWLFVLNIELISLRGYIWAPYWPLSWDDKDNVTVENG